MMNLFNRNRKAETKEIKIKITWINGEVEYTTAGVASLITDLALTRLKEFVGRSQYALRLFPLAKFTNIPYFFTRLKIRRGV